MASVPILFVAFYLLSLLFSVTIKRTGTLLFIAALLSLLFVPVFTLATIVDRSAHHNYSFDDPEFRRIVIQCGTLTLPGLALIWLPIWRKHIRNKTTGGDEIAFICPECGQHISAKYWYKGGMYKCPKCNKRVHVPLESIESEAR